MQASDGPDALLQQARTALQSGDRVRAKRKAEQVLIAWPNDYDASVVLISVAVLEEDFKQAISLLVEAADVHAADVHADKRAQLLLQAADFMLRDGQRDRGIRTLRALVDEFPDDLMARRRLALALNNQGFRFDANELLRELMRETPLSEAELVGLMRPMQPWATFQSKPSASDHELVDRVGILNVVAALQSRGDVDDALAALEPSELLKSGDPAAQSCYGWLLSTNQRFDELSRWAATTDARHQRYPAYWIAMGNLAVHRRDRSARFCFLQAMLREPSFLEAIQGLAAAMRLEGETEGVDRIEKRVSRIRSTQRLLMRTGSEPNNLNLRLEIAEHLRVMGRELEGVLWQEIVFLQQPESTPSRVKIEQFRQSLSGSDWSGISEPSLLCGFTLEGLATHDAMLAKIKASVSDTVTNASPRAETMGAVNTRHQIVLHDEASDLGVAFQYRNASVPVQRNFRLFEALGAGCVWLDFDQDGWVDLYLGQAACDPQAETSSTVQEDSNRLYRNGEHVFSDVTLVSLTTDWNYTLGMTSGDLNQDGFPDLVIGNVGVNRVLINQGDGTFREQPIGGDWNKGKLTSSLAIADITGDALPEVIESVYVDDPQVFDEVEFDAAGKAISLPSPKQVRAARTRYFSGVTGDDATMGLFDTSAETLTTGLGLIVTDIDGDGGNEVFSANDQNPNHLWKRTSENSKPPAWTDFGIISGVAFGKGGKPFACMGVAVADFDRNGKLDLHITNYSGECSNQYMQQTGETLRFVDQALVYGFNGPTVGMVGFGVQAIDFDNDSDEDLVIANGHIDDFVELGLGFEMPTQVLSRVGETFELSDVAGEPSYWKARHLGRAIGKADWNRDGKIDFAVTHLKRPVAVMRNSTASDGQFLQLQLVGLQSERDAIGATVKVTFDGRTIVKAIQSGDGYMAKNESVLCFGLGKANEAESISIEWPSGQVQEFRGVGSGTRYLAIEGANALWNRWER